MPPEGTATLAEKPEISMAETETSPELKSRHTTSTSTKEISDHKKSKSENDTQLDPRLTDIHSDYFPPLEIVWKNVALFVYLHIAALAGLYFLLSGQVMWKSLLWAGLVHCAGALGITAGAHRLWAHKSYKARFPLRLLLTLFQTVSFQNSIHEWSRDHRVHHKYSETHADPHNAKRGFFFAHIGWLLARKHPLVKEKGKAIDMSDLEADPIIMFQKKYYTPLVLTISFLIPTLVPWYFWGESFIVSFCFCAMFRYTINLHATWLVNSAAHMWGNRPYDQTINPAENWFVAFWAWGEGWHNYHHTFPWDYKTAELGFYSLNLTSAFIDFMAWIGWAYDLKTVSDKVVMDRVKRTGDGTHSSIQGPTGHSHGHAVINDDGSVGAWGWGDVNIPKEDSEVTETLYPVLVDKDD